MYWLCGTRRFLDEECLTNRIHYYYDYVSSALAFMYVYVCLCIKKSTLSALLLDEVCSKPNAP